MKVSLNRSELVDLDTDEIASVLDYAVEQYYAREDDTNGNVQWVYSIDGITVTISD